MEDQLYIMGSNIDHMVRSHPHRVQRHKFISEFEKVTYRY